MVPGSSSGNTGDNNSTMASSTHEHITQYEKMLTVQVYMHYLFYDKLHISQCMRHRPYS